MALKSVIFSFIFLFFLQFNYAQNFSLDYYLPENVSYNPKIPKPSEIIGFVPGDWHASHDKVVQYMSELAKNSDRIHIENRGFTYEKRPLILLTITSPENHDALESIKEKRKKLTDDKKDNADYESLPVVVNQGFSVHGNEPSGVNASLILAYYLAAAEGDHIDRLLRETIILLDPSFNPDGIQRFAHWTNSNRSLNLNPDPNDREFDETWPGGRTNHYWFDLNRDWLPVQLPESQARIKTFYNWRPNILTDHHEMGSNSTFFFQPGIPQRTNPLTPKINQELTGRIGEFHAKALDSIGSFYYSKESFDDFYYGKGSTFPDINGSIGILFEQASSRGSGQVTDNGLLEFRFTVRNQFTTALSTLEAAVNLKKDLLKLQDNFYYNTVNNIEDSYYVIDNHKNPYLAKSLHEVLKRHEIKTYALNKDNTINGKTFKKQTAFAVPLKQLQGRLAKAMFESRTTFQDSIFYDVSAWDFQHAFGVDFAKTKTVDLGSELDIYKLPSQDFTMSEYAYAVRWSDFNAPKLIYKLENCGLRVKIATKKFQTKNKDFEYGTAIIPVQNQSMEAKQLYELLKSLNKELSVEITSLDTGLTSGINLGSPNVENIKLPKIALLVGEGVRSYDAGEIWHLLDVRFEIPVTKLDTKDFRASRLDKYTHLVVPSSSNRFLSKSDLEDLKSWVRNGGTIIGYRNAVRWLNSSGFINLDFKQDSLEVNGVSFENRSKIRGARQIGGAIFEAEIDRSHPINFGFTNDKIALFRNTEQFIKPNKYSYNNPIIYTENPLLSGYINNSNLEMLKGSVPFQVNRFGSGRVLVFTDNTNFRGFWLGTTKLFLNSLFLSDLM
jgi:hypothetical protein